MTVTTSDLRSALTSLSVGRGYLPVHQGVRIVCDGSQVTVEASDCDGECPRLGINRAYLADLVRVAGTESITLQITDDRKPIRCDAGDTTQIIMPVRLS